MRYDDGVKELRVRSAPKPVQTFGVPTSLQEAQTIRKLIVKRIEELESMREKPDVFLQKKELREHEKRQERVKADLAAMREKIKEVNAVISAESMRMDRLKIAHRNDIDVILDFYNFVMTLEMPELSGDQMMLLAQVGEIVRRYSEGKKPCTPARSPSPTRA